MINTKLQSIIDTKSAIGNAIVNKGGTITSETPFFNYAAQIDGISTGTPQTIFQASDGSKWALTNAVNLTNVSNNVTSDFNYWQPANNSTSDPILNVGTVGANISGNIQLVPVNQVNISQYVNIVATDIDGAKYEGFNGFDQITNPTPTGNTTFNRWLLNNSATGTVIFANTVITNGGTFNGSNTSVNEASMSFVGNTANYGDLIFSVTTNNGFIYVGGFGPSFANGNVSKFHESNLALVGNTASYGGGIVSVTTNNGFIYAGGFSNQRVQKFHESNLAFVGSTNNYGGTIQSITTNNGFIYAGGQDNRTVQKFHESNLAFVGNTASYGATVLKVTINNGFIYAGGAKGVGKIKQYYESNLVFVNETTNIGEIESIAINNGFIYAIGVIGDFGSYNGSVRKFYESNLVQIDNTAGFGYALNTITINDGFIFTGGQTNQTVQKFYESNLAFVGNTANYGGDIFSVTTNNGFIYAGGITNQRVQKFNEKGLTPEILTFYTATKIKE
jgi:hypothetical protein